MACSTSGPVKKKWWSSTSTGSPLGRHTLTSHGQSPQLFALLGIHADHRLAVGLVVLDLLVEVAELCIPVGVGGALERLDVGLQTEPFPLQQSAHRRGGDRVPPPGQLLGQVPQRLGRPPATSDRRAGPAPPAPTGLGGARGPAGRLPCDPHLAGGRGRAGTAPGRPPTRTRPCRRSPRSRQPPARPHARHHGPAAAPRPPTPNAAGARSDAATRPRTSRRADHGPPSVCACAHTTPASPKTENGTLFPASFTRSATSATSSPSGWAARSSTACAPPTTPAPRWTPKPNCRRWPVSWTRPTLAPPPACARAWPRR
jgi:hypothetical protein